MPDRTAAPPRGSGADRVCLFQRDFAVGARSSLSVAPKARDPTSMLVFFKLRGDRDLLAGKTRSGSAHAKVHRFANFRLRTLVRRHNESRRSHQAVPLSASCPRTPVRVDRVGYTDAKTATATPLLRVPQAAPSPVLCTILACPAEPSRALDSASQSEYVSQPIFLLTWYLGRFLTSSAGGNKL
jgi:hypothetical protein